MKNMKNMTNRISMLVMLLAISATMISLEAQTYSSPVLDNNPFRSQTIVGGGVYDGTVYQPFSTELPSDAVDPTRNGQNRSAKPSVKTGFDTPGEANQSEEFPIGDGVWGMMAMALAFCGVITLRRKRAASNVER